MNISGMNCDSRNNIIASIVVVIEGVIWLIFSDAICSFSQRELMSTRWQRDFWNSNFFSR